MSFFDTPYHDNSVAVGSAGPCVLTEFPDHCPVAKMRLHSHTSMTVGDLFLPSMLLLAAAVAGACCFGYRRFSRALLS